MNKLDENFQQKKRAHAKLLTLQSKVYESFLAMEQAAFSDSELTRKHKELIAIGISVVIDCEPCMEWHIEHAAQAGATMREVLNAVEVGMSMGGGPAVVSACFALGIVDLIFESEEMTSG